MQLDCTPAYFTMKPGTSNCIDFLQRVQPLPISNKEIPVNFGVKWTNTAAFVFDSIAILCENRCSDPHLKSNYIYAAALPSVHLTAGLLGPLCHLFYRNFVTGKRQTYRVFDIDQNHFRFGFVAVTSVNGSRSKFTLKKSRLVPTTFLRS